MAREVSSFPWVTLALAAAAVGVHLQPEWTAHLQLDRAAGEWWPLVTCHFTHWSTDHFAWDVMMFALLGGACEVASRRRFFVTLLASVVLIPLAVLAFQPQLQTYRGLSGLDSALFGLLAFDLLGEKRRASDRRSVFAIGLLIAAFLVKTSMETISGTAVFADSVAGGFVPVPLAHLVGFGIGAITSVAVGWRKRLRSQSRSAPLRWPAI